MNHQEKPAPPRIAILLAVYEPRLDWLEELLLSLEAQSCPNLCLYVRDDCSPTVPPDELRRCVERCIRSFPVELRQNEKNLGSNKTFERLTVEAEGDYFAYCDQDDIWMPDKLLVLRDILESGTAGMVYSDVKPIDADGNPLGDSICDVRKRYTFPEGEGLTSSLIYRTPVFGCTMLIRSEIAKAAVPFPACMVHDHFLSFACAARHAVAFAPEPLVAYRLHGDNQTGVLMNIHSKKDYLAQHTAVYCQWVETLLERFPEAVPPEAVAWAEARRDNAAGKRGSRRRLFALRRINKSTTLFELVALRLPEPLFKLALEIIRRGIL